MIFKAIGDIHEIAPPFMLGKINNRSLPPEEMLIFKVRGVSIKEKDEHEKADMLDRSRFTPDKALENVNARIYETTRSHVVEIKNFFVDEPTGPREVTDFDELCRVAPPEIIAWLIATIMSGEALAAAETKNYMRASG